jgi:arginase family enzyme
MMTPTFAIPPTFLGTTLDPAAARVWVAGVPLDVGTTNRAGARDGPLAVRRARRMLADGDHPGGIRESWGWPMSATSLSPSVTSPVPCP